MYTSLVSGEVARLIELAWYDGLRTGLFAGALVGLVAGVLIAASLLRKP